MARGLLPPAGAFMGLDNAAKVVATVRPLAKSRGVPVWFEAGIETGNTARSIGPYPNPARSATVFRAMCQPPGAGTRRESPPPILLDGRESVR
jgi:hypothetical protein